MTGPTQTPPCPECAPGAAAPHIEPSLLHVHLTPYGYLLYTPGHERPSFVESMREAAYRAGYAEAVARLRDETRYRDWWSAQPKPDPAYEQRAGRDGDAQQVHPAIGVGGGYWQGPARRYLADYLETVGPDGPDVTASEPDRGEGEWDAHDCAEHEAQLQAHRDEYGPEIEAERQAEGPSLYAYQCAEDMDYTIARKKGAPVTGWLHAGGGPPWRVLVAESREQADVFHPPHTTVEVYDGDEPTILITEAYPMLFRQSDQPKRT